MKNTKNAMVMDEQELSMVSGGGWGYNLYHNEDEYKAVGIKTDWTSWYNPFQSDKFYFKGEKISDETASKIVFFVRATNPVAGSFTKGDALNYANSHHDQYKNDMKLAND